MPDNAWVSLSPCPYCNASVSYGLGACGLCGAALEWNVLPDGFKLKTDAGKPLEVVRVLGRGGFGVTYLADLAGVRVAVKECFPDGLVTRDSVGNVVPKPGCEAEFTDILRKFLLEARLLNQIKHPVSTKFLALWQANNTAYLMMEFIEGETLEARIARGSRLSEFETVALLEPILDLLEGVHTQKLLHRDIKPANIMLTKDGVELIDFGSVIKFDAQRSTKITSKILTPAYAPLELYGSQVRLGPSSDLYSLAASMYEAMTGVRVPSALDRSNGAVVQPLEAMLNSVSREFSKLIAQALELRIDDRFASVHEMRAALRGVPVFSKPVSSTSSFRASVTSNAPVRSSSKRLQIPSWALALIGMIGLIVGVNRLLAFNDWRQGLEKTRVAREQFLTDQCKMLIPTEETFGCQLTIQEISTESVKLEMRLSDQQGLMDLDTVFQRWNSPKVSDFVYELAGNTLDLLDTRRVEMVIGGRMSDSRLGTRYEISRDDQASYLARPATPEIRKLRAARAKKRLSMPSSETYFSLLAKREIDRAAFATKRSMKITRLFWKENSDNGASIFIGHPGTDIEILALSAEKDFRLELRDTILRLHRALPGIDYIGVFIGHFDQNAGAVWNVSVSNFYNNNEFEALVKANDSQLNDIWSFSTDQGSRSGANKRLARAWQVPVPVRGTKELRALTVVQLSQDFGSFQPPAPARSFTAFSYAAVDALPFSTNSVDYGNTKLLTGCCVAPTKDVYVGVQSLEPVVAQRQFKLRMKYDPPKWLRLRLSNDRSNVIVELEKQNWARGYLFELDRFGLHDPNPFLVIVSAPVSSVTVPFKVFEESNFVRFMALNFDSVFLVRVDRFGNSSGGAEVGDLAASAIETSAITRDQLIALRNGESLEFGPNLKWVKK